MAGGNLKELIVKILGDDTHLESTLDKAGGRIQSFGAATTKTGAVLTAGLTLPIIGMGVAAVSAAMDAQSHLAQTEAVIKSTGGTAGVTVGHVNDLAGSIMQLSGADDDAVQAGENMLLTFTNIKNKGGIFDKATLAAVDLATALNNGVVPSAEQVQAQALQIGKALNDPISGMTKLQRIGVTFSDDQVKLVTRLQNSGNMMGAQKVILDELAKEFGGSASNAGQTFAGKMALLSNTLGNLAEAAGDKLLPALTDLATQATPYIVKLADAVSTMSPMMLLVVGGVLAAAAALGPLLIVLGSVITAIGAILPVAGAVATFLAGPFLLPVIAVVAGVAALVAGIVLLVTHWQQVVAAIQGNPVFQTLASLVPVVVAAFGQLWSTIQAQVAPILAQLGSTLQNQLMPAWANIVAAFDTAKPVLIAIGAVVGGIVLVALGLLIGVLNGVFSALGPLLSAAVAVFGGVVQIISGSVRLIVGIFLLLVGLVKGIFTGDWTTLHDGLENLKAGALGIIGGLVSGITGLFSGLVGAVVGLVGGFVSGVVGWFTNLWSTLVGHSIIPDMITGIIRWFAELPGRVGAILGALIGQAIGLFISLAAGAINLVSSMVHTVTNVAAGLLNALVSPIRQAKDTIGGILSALQGMFSGLRLQLPHIKLPHFHISGSFSLNPPSIPTIGVDWYAKGGIFNMPSVIGVGEKGPEAVIPLDKLGSTAGGGGSSAATPVEFTLDGRTIVRAFLPYLIDELRLAGAIRDY
jgi:phage-related protein